MVGPERSRRDYLALGAIDPVSGQMGTVQVSFDRMQAVGRRSMGHAKECGHIVPVILQHPTAVFEGCDRTRMRTGRALAGAAIAEFPAKLTIPTAVSGRPTRGRCTSCSSTTKG
jgi:hypothetical protein